MNRYAKLEEVIRNSSTLDRHERNQLSAMVKELGKTDFAKFLIKATIGGILGFIVMGFAYGFLNKHYSVWAMEMEGKAKLAEATQSRQIQIEQAKGEKMAAEYTAEAIAIVGKAAKAFPEYRTQTFIQSFGDALNNGNIQKIIYVPTEANIPIMEANRLKGE